MSHAQQPPAIRVRRTAQPRPATQATARPVQAAMQSHHGRSSNPLLVVAGIILAVFGEEFGLLGNLLLLLLYTLIIGRGLIIAAQAQDTFCRLLAGSISLTFFTYVFVIMGMVSGILPVVGVPFPLISYGGTSLVTLLLGFGILMSIQTHKKLMAT